MVYRHNYGNFRTAFNDVTGAYIRSGIIRNGKETEEDPFMAPFPELLDVGIMGSCLHGRTGLCLKAGVECYQDGANKNEPDMPFGDFEALVRQCKGKTYQFALGGRGDPDMHRDFEDILACARENEIVPNFTTSGIGMDRRKAALCKKYCGAVAVSWYRSRYTLDAVSMLIEAGVKTNIHYVVNAETVREAVSLLYGEPGKGLPERVNAVVFLLHKPVGLGSREKMITKDDALFREFLELAVKKATSSARRRSLKIGFDSCTVPALLRFENELDTACLDTCEGARWSAYVSPDMRLMPCSFDSDRMRWAVSLRENTVEEAWHSKEFDDFRRRLANACPRCHKRALCMGGCPIVPEIVLCERKGNNEV